MDHTNNNDLNLQRKICHKTICPVETEEFKNWKQEIKSTFHAINTKIDETNKSKIDLNLKLTEIVDTERLAKLKLEEQLEIQRKETDSRFQQLLVLQTELLVAVKGNWASKGVITRTDNIEQQLKDIKEELKQYATNIEVKLLDKQEKEKKEIHDKNKELHQNVEKKQKELEDKEEKLLSRVDYIERSMIRSKAFMAGLATIVSIASSFLVAFFRHMISK